MIRKCEIIQPFLCKTNPVFLRIGRSVISDPISSYHYSFFCITEQKRSHKPAFPIENISSFCYLTNDLVPMIKPIQSINCRVYNSYRTVNFYPIKSTSISYSSFLQYPARRSVTYWGSFSQCSLKSPTTG